MAKITRLNSGEHFQKFVSNQVDSGRFGSASDLVLASLRLMEEQQLHGLRQALIDGENSGTAGAFDAAKIKRMGREKARLAGLDV